MNLAFKSCPICKPSDGKPLNGYFEKYCPNEDQHFLMYKTHVLIKIGKYYIRDDTGSPVMIWVRGQPQTAKYIDLIIDYENFDYDQIIKTFELFEFYS